MAKGRVRAASSATAWDVKMKLEPQCQRQRCRQCTGMQSKLKTHVDRFCRASSAHCLNICNSTHTLTHKHLSIYKWASERGRPISRSSAGFNWAQSEIIASKWFHSNKGHTLNNIFSCGCAMHVYVSLVHVRVGAHTRIARVFVTLQTNSVWCKFMSCYLHSSYTYTISSFDDRIVWCHIHWKQSIL